jgi:hypothetical protein
MSNKSNIEISIIFSGDTQCFNSKNAKKRMKEELKKKYHALDNKKDFLKNHPYEDLNRFLKENYIYSINKSNDNESNDNEFTLDFKYETSEKSEKSEKSENVSNDLRAKHKEKMQMLKNKRNNTYGKKIKNMKKDMGDDLMKNYLNAQENMKDYPIPDPQEIMNNKDKYLQQFKEYENMINMMKKSNPDAESMFKDNAYHKYAEQILEALRK